MKYRRIIKEWIKVAWILVLLTSNLTIFAQTNLKELEDQRLRLEQEIKVLNGQLKQTQENKATVLDQYLTLDKQVKQRQRLLNMLERQVAYIDDNIVRTNEVVTALEVDLKTLEEEYANMLQAAYRQQLTNSRWFFILSSENFNQASQRWRYLKQYDDYRQKQVRLILETQTMLESKVTQLEKDKVEKELLYKKEREQRTKIYSELNAKNELLGRLKTNESQLINSLEAQEQRNQQLSAAINNTINREMARRKRNTSTSGPTTAASTTTKLGFQGMRGSLPWPVATGKIIQTFGKHPHPQYENVETINNGIDIETTPNAEVKAVYPGRVAVKQFIPGFDNVILVSHGNYYTAYSNLEITQVSKGQTIAQGQVVGRLGGRKNKLHFEIWKEKQRLDPELWIRK